MKSTLLNYNKTFSIRGKVYLFILSFNFRQAGTHALPHIMLLSLRFSLLLFCWSVPVSGNDVEWIRTAKDTTNRLTLQKPDLSFSADFNSTVAVTIDR